MREQHGQWMSLAIAAAAERIGLTSPNPWVGALLHADGTILNGATGIGGSPHAEAAVLQEARANNLDLANATLAVTLEPCAHIGRNPACTTAIIESGIKHVVVGITDPDPRVSGHGITTLQNAGINVTTGVEEDTITQQLAPYVKHRSTGRPYVVLKMAMTMDGRIAAPDGTSKWITGAEARKDVHELRERCDAVIVGAGTVRTDNPSLNVRLDKPASDRQPQRIVLGDIPPNANVHPARSWKGNLDDLLDDLGAQGLIQVLVEGGADVAGSFHRAGLVDRYVFYVAPALLGGDNGRPVVAGDGVAAMSDAMHGKLIDVTTFGDDIRITMEPR
jgi:diaminohydroxyphosphoribosylaminopyrimidine deaminase/5-amino-6-(5-phosphoribosylamino)uracil reductase